MLEINYVRFLFASIPIILSLISIVYFYYNIKLNKEIIKENEEAMKKIEEEQKLKELKRKEEIELFMKTYLKKPTKNE